MQKLKSLLAKIFSSGRFFYEYLGLRIGLMLLLAIGVGLLDSIGLVLFIPLLKLVLGGEGEDIQDTGGLSFVIDFFTNLGFEITIYSIFGFLIILFIFKGFLKSTSQFYLVLIKLILEKKVRLNSIKLLKNLKFSAFTLQESGKIQNVMTGETARMNGAFKSYFAAIQNWIFLLVYFVMAAITNFEFTMMVAFGAVLSNFLFKKLYKRTKSLSLELSGVGHDFQGLVIQLVSFFKYLKVTSFLPQFSAKIENVVDDNERVIRKLGFYESLLVGAREPLVYIIIFASLYIQIILLERSSEGILLSLLFFYRALSFVMLVQNNWNTYLKDSGAIITIKDFFKVLAGEREIHGKLEYQGLQQCLHFNDLSFYYPTKPGEAVLKNINLEIRKNQSIAFVGVSGSGKTTLLNIIGGLFKPDNDQSFTIDGVSINELNTKSYRRRIGYVTQELVMFNGTIFENVCLWEEKTAANIRRFEKACEQARILEFINTLDSRENTLVGNNGISLSGGQRQRINIARELYRDIDILVLDEATSALDSENERAIQENMEAIHGRCTLIMVAHRLSTIRNADAIVYLEKGEIIAKGSFDELINNSAGFRELAYRQGLVG